MNGLKHFFLLLAVTLLSACSFLQSFHSQSPEYIDILISEQHYSKAQNVLQNIRPDHPDYPALMAQKARLQKLISTLESTTLAQTKALQKQNKWHQAQQTLHTALAKLPQSPVLRKAEEDFLGARKKRINELNMQIDIHKGIWLKDAEPLLAAIVSTMPDDYERQQQQRAFNREKSRTLKRLVRCSREAMEDELYELGRRCLNLVSAIDKEHKYKEELLTARSRLQRHDQIQHQRQIRKTNALLKELKQGYSHENLLRASQHLQQLSHHHQQNSEEKRYSTILKQELDRGIAQNMDAGRQLYSEGKITEALSIWTSLQKITPENEVLEAHISRARRVLKKLERLGKKQPSVNRASASQ